MSDLSLIFERISKLVKAENENDLILAIFKGSINPVGMESDAEENLKKYKLLKIFIQNIIHEIDLLALEISTNEEILISVKNQKLLRTCFHILISLGISTCLIPGLGISLDKRCISAHSIPHIKLTDEQKYDILVICTDFLQRSYNVPVLKNIIITFHLSDYLAALIQLAFAPLKKPGVYPRFTMTQDMYDKFNSDRQKYIKLYDYLVSNCFQPMLMKELLVLQSVADPEPPLFVKRVIAKEMSRRLTVSGGLISLIRCFIESHEMDTGVEWKKIDMICKIVATKHGNMSENDYLKNIMYQLKQILSLNNVHYLATAMSCLLTLYKKYNECEPILTLVKEVFNTLNYDDLTLKSNLPGTIILTPQEVEHSLQFLQACTSMIKLDLPSDLLKNNLLMLFLLRIKCTTNETKTKITDIILKSLEILNMIEIQNIIEKFLFGPEESNTSNISIEEYKAGLAVKCSAVPVDHPKNDALMNFIDIFYATTNNTLINKLFESCLHIFINLKAERQIKAKNLINVQGEPQLLSSDENYAVMLQILAEISASEKIIGALKENPCIVINFMESLLLKDITNSDEECNTIALVLLNTVLSNINDTKIKELKERLYKLLPLLKKLSKDDSEYISILCNESISLIIADGPKSKGSEYEKALSNIYDDLLPVRAHGVMEMTKLIEKADPETISRRHYLFCLFQEQLKDTDSYVYLSAVNGIASLAMHCTSEALTVLCKEFLEISDEQKNIVTTESQNRTAELRMKIGDIIVKVTRKLGEMAVVHKTVLLNTMLCACRDDDPLIRASALSNLAEIALVLNYKIGTIIYEVLLCIWSIIETDKAIECRRAGVMVVSSLLKGLGKDTLIELKENLLPIYRTLNKLYKDANEDTVVRLHAQIALEELNDIVTEYLLPNLPSQKEFLMLDKKDDIFFK
ncbi:transport and Golgi organization protein 6 homolog [Vanessa atalanta]|uniref:transport and Golgi organization protein 6 homolog n=1 Tax=Vanessa atalanta TaxID=42275 RepID=UPI001FCCFF61|nr:transport and Golgi organization protein 6 homolog [Vanessa atalanta]